MMQKHRELDKVIEQKYRNHGDNVEITELKKQKLHIKEEIALVERQILELTN